MGFKDFLQNFMPHRWLNHKKTGTARLFEGLGKALDYAGGMVDMVRSETRVKTAVNSLGTRELEHGLPVEPLLDIETRRKRILAKKREQGGIVNTEEFESSLGLLTGTIVTVIPFHSDYLMQINMEGTQSAAIDFELAEEYIDENKLAHIAHTYQLEQTKGSIEHSSPDEPIMYYDDPLYCGSFYAGGENDLC
ncbi:putative phage tail protein [Brevibacillus borstelensis]|uniref:putative phage tail protein n=1 Tax=Brevibacillus borstelensis TaxID=45462 RepID=UPI0030FB2B9F